MEKLLRLLAVVWPVLVALIVAVLTLRAWLHGAAIFGVALVPPKDVDTWAKVLGFTIGIPAGVLALFTFMSSVRDQHRANMWKRTEYLAARFDRLETSTSCKAVMRLLDYNATYVDLEGLQGTVVNDRMVMSALAPRQQRGAYTRHEQLLRDSFDTFFGELDRIGAMAAARLVERRDLKPFVDYWLRLFDPAERGRPKEYGAALRRYVRVFHFEALGAMLEERGLMKCRGPAGKAQSASDSALLRAYNPEWASPGHRTWEDRVSDD